MYTTLSVVIIVQPGGLPDEMQDPLRFTDKDGMWGCWHFLSDFNLLVERSNVRVRQLRARNSRPGKAGPQSHRVLGYHLSQQTNLT